MHAKTTNTEKLSLPYECKDINLSLHPAPGCAGKPGLSVWLTSLELWAGTPAGATHLHSALLCKNELHWSGRFVSLDMDSRIAMICLNDGRFWRREKGTPWDFRRNDRRKCSHIRQRWQGSDWVFAVIRSHRWRKPNSSSAISYP